MYCEKCNKQSPDNFTACAYCGAKFKPKKSHMPIKFSPKHGNSKISFKSKVMSLIIIAVLLSVAAITTAALTGQKPERVIKTMASSISNSDAEAYYGIFDDYYKSFLKDSLYYDDGVMFDEMVLPMKESDAFYTKQCGEGYKLSYDITSSEILDGKELEEYNKYLTDTYGYKRVPKSVCVMNVTLKADGEKGEYKTVYKNIYCIKLSGKWYRGVSPEEIK